MKTLASHFTYFLSLSLGCFLFLSCGSDSTKSEETPKNTTEVNPAKKEKYSISTEKAVANFTAYKFTERAGVSGKFTDVTIQNAHSGTNLNEMLSGATFRIPIASISTNDISRDKKIMEHFFGEMSETESLSGAVNEVKGDAKGGVCEVTLSMNNLSKKITLEYKNVNNSYYVLKGVLDVGNWEATNALDALNTICKDLHTGKDGVSKLWPDILLAIQLPLETMSQP